MYELMADFWPTADQDPSSTPPMVEYARIWREVPKLVFSRTLESAEWNSIVVHDVVVEEIEALKAEEGGDLSLGGAESGRRVLRQGAGGRDLALRPSRRHREGKPMVGPDQHVDLRLLETRTFGNGVVLLHYAVDRG